MRQDRFGEAEEAEIRHVAAVDHAFPEIFADGFREAVEEEHVGVAVLVAFLRLLQHDERLRGESRRRILQLFVDFHAGRGGDEQDRRRGMLRADDVDDVRQRDGELFDLRIPAVVEHVQRRILDVRQHGGDFGLAAAVAGEAEIDDFAVQHAGEDVGGAHARTRRASALRDGRAVHDGGAVVHERRGGFEFRVVVEADGE